MLHLEAPRGFHYVERPDHVAIQVGTRIFEAVANAGLSREMDNHFWVEFVRKGVEFNLILQHALGHRKV